MIGKRGYMVIGTIGALLGSMLAVWTSEGSILFAVVSSLVIGPAMGWGTWRLIEGD